MGVPKVHVDTRLRNDSYGGSMSDPCLLHLLHRNGGADIEQTLDWSRDNHKYNCVLHHTITCRMPKLSGTVWGRHRTLTRVFLETCLTLLGTHFYTFLIRVFFSGLCTFPSG